MSDKTSESFIDKCRTRARSIKTRCEELGSSVSLAQAYELLAASDGHRTWAAMRAANVPDAAPTDQPYRTPDGDVASRWYFSVEMARLISVDAAAADAKDGDATIEQLLRAAYADISYVFFDGEETPSVRFRGTEFYDEHRYTVIADIEASPIKDMKWTNERLDLGENVLEWRPVACDHTDGPGDASFPGSGNRPRSFPWLEVKIPLASSM